MDLSLIGIIIGLAGLMYACMKGLSIIVAAPIFSLVVAGTGGLPLLEAFLETFMGGAVGYVKAFFPMFMLGAVFGKVMEDTGAASAVGNWVIDKIGSDKAILAVVAACGVLTYGGISLFVVVFTMYPLAMGIFKEADLPRRLIPGSIALGAFTFTMTAIPGTPQIQNIIPTEFFGTDAMAAPIIGLVGAVIMSVGGVMYLNREARKAKENGEFFDVGDAEEYEDVSADELPSFGLSIIPLVSVVLLLNLFGMDINAALFWGVVLAIVLLWDKLETVAQLKETLNTGATGSLTAIMNTGLAVGFGSVVQAVPGFDTMVEGLTRFTFGNPYLYGVVSTNTLAGATGSASGGMSIALEALSESFLAMGGNPEMLHRTIALASGGLDVLPHNGAVITLLIVCGLTHEDSYKDIFVVSLAIPVLAGLVGVLLATMGIA
ncbi:GntP family permease [Natroniella sp. ANB-PHB2]|uniref:GntP family permease n=1 Tax=Natroniella sp. ANB-PHB2 TaxID=3384444 RepID=UPI0038D3E22E